MRQTSEQTASNTDVLFNMWLVAISVKHCVALHVMLDVHPLVLCFRVKYYPSDPLMLKEELSRYCQDCALFYVRANRV